MFYVIVDKINGRKSFLKLVEELHARGLVDDSIRYFQGGWDDYKSYLVPSYLVFDHEEDAIVYSLANNKTYTTQEP